MPTELPHVDAWLSAEQVRLLACPDCRSSLELVPGPEAVAGLVCSRCTLVFPVTRGIPILLPRPARSHEVELPLLQALASSASAGAVRPALDATLALLQAREGEKSWEWEDEVFWREKYRKQTRRFLSGEPMDENRWPVRFWQREFLIERLPETSWRPDKVLLDIGCGAGHNFRVLLSDRWHPSSLYIAADVSLDALELNRLRNPHANALYVLCSADRLPFRDGTIDLLCYFGILHHTERQAGTIEEDSRLLKPGGVTVLHEAITRKSARPAFLPVHDHGSEHEETIDRLELLQGIEGAPGLEIAAQQWSHTSVMGVSKFVLRRWLRQRAAWEIVARIDRLSLRLLGRVSDLFAPGEVMMVLRKDGERAS